MNLKKELFNNIQLLIVLLVMLCMLVNNLQFTILWLAGHDNTELFIDADFAEDIAEENDTEKTVDYHIVYTPLNCFSFSNYLISKFLEEKYRSWLIEVVIPPPKFLIS